MIRADSRGLARISEGSSTAFGPPFSRGCARILVVLGKFPEGHSMCHFAPIKFAVRQIAVSPRVCGVNRSKKTREPSREFPRTTRALAPEGKGNRSRRGNRRGIGKGATPLTLRSPRSAPKRLIGVVKSRLFSWRCSHGGMLGGMPISPPLGCVAGFTLTNLVISSVGVV